MKKLNKNPERLKLRKNPPKIVNEWYENNNKEKPSLGVTGLNLGAKYEGLIVLMKPTKFLELTPPLPSGTNNLFIEEHIRNEKPIGSPFLFIKIPDEWIFGNFSPKVGFAKVRGHEGRNRMNKIFQIFGNDPIETHLFIRHGDDNYKLNRQEISNLMIENLNKLMYSERWGNLGGNIVWGPIFEGVL